jgi:hypothetical protein
LTRPSNWIHTFKSGLVSLVLKHKHKQKTKKLNKILDDGVGVILSFFWRMWDRVVMTRERLCQRLLAFGWIPLALIIT